jgi:serine/threonine-protein kinase
MTDEDKTPDSVEKIGRYQIEEEIGRGGMATVYISRDPQFGREVAIKVLPREFTHNPHFRERFEREAQAIAQLEHSAIVPVYDYGQEEGRTFLVMRMMKGGTLADRINDGPLPLKDAARILDQVAAALDVAHQRGVIHRDVKPGNILFDEHGDPFISDFGLVKIGESASSLTGSMIVGTPAYMAPEMSQAGGLTSLVDVYALGVTLYQMVAGRLPYEADTPLGTMLAHAVEPIPDVKTVKPDIPDPVAAVIKQAIAKQPANRYQTAKQLATDFRAAVEGRPLQYQTEQAVGTTRQIPGSDVRKRLDEMEEEAQAEEEEEQEVAKALPWPVLGGIAGLIVLLIVGAALLGGGDTREPPEPTDNVPAVAEEATATEEPAPTEPEVTNAPTEEPTTEPTAEPTATELALSELIGGGGESIVYTSSQAGNFEIYLISLATREQTRLTEFDGPDTSPVWSPDGTRIAFVSRQNGNQDIYIMDADGSNIQQITDDIAGDFDPAWSPDGTQLAFASARDGNNEIYVVSLEGENAEPIRLTENIVQDVQPTWSPDGEQLAFVSYREGNANVYIMSASTGTIRDRITEGTLDHLYPDWSPDGQTIIYASSSDGDWEIYAYDLESERTRQLTDNTEYDSTPVWSPDGMYIAYSNGEQYRVNQGITIMEADGSNSELIMFVDSSYNAELPAWQPPPQE